MKQSRTQLDSYSRRSFISSGTATCALALYTFSGLLKPASAQNGQTDVPLTPHPALHWEKLPGRKVKCLLCPRECQVDDRERGYCGVRENQNGEYFTLVWGSPCTLNVDPVEKKPLFHFLPGQKIFSLATVGCNVNCKFCQNWQISQIRPEQERSYDVPPLKIIDLAKESGSLAIAHTYTEPVVFYEYVKDIGNLALNQHLKNVIITNGYIKEKPLLELLPCLSAVKIDLKAFTERFYKELVDGELKPVLDTLRRLIKAGIWTEIVYLVIPTQNDEESELRSMSHWIATELGRDVPVHFTRFHPEYMLKTLPPTPVATLDRARDIALAEGLRYVYVGNVPGNPGEHTYCPSCKAIVIRRSGFRVELDGFDGGTCRKCGYKIPGIWT